MGKIRINNMSFHTYNGVYPEEKKLGQRLEMDVELSYPIETAVHDDDLTTTIHYGHVYNDIEDFVLNHPYNLIESLANNVLQMLQTKYPETTGIKLRVRKYAVPIAGIFDNVEIEVASGDAK
ncbi:dihydroneopterin aldolase [Furfurilactobacillus siliginis]|nr:dihydroneopterin aldolase [Furfurilactobacillus siliginis]GEK28399.1 7,8-dihydroneopterin aldolase [Furfurilactobacillus siliginis]